MSVAFLSARNSARLAARARNQEVVLKRAFSTNSTASALSSRTTCTNTSQFKQTLFKKYNCANGHQKFSTSTTNVEETAEQTGGVEARMAFANIESKVSVGDNIQIINIKVKENHRDNIIFKSGQHVEVARFKHTDMKKALTMGDTLFGELSLTNSYKDYLETGILRVAVRKSNEPFIKWIFNQSKAGDSLLVQMGGDDFAFIRDPENPDEVGKNVVLIGGGMAATPLVSILHHIKETEPDTKVIFIHSAKNRNEFLFKEEIENLTKENSNIRAAWKYTGKDEGEVAVADKDGEKRISVSFLKDLGIEVDNSCFYVCGPKGMVRGIRDLLKEMGAKHVRDNRIAGREEKQ